MILVTHFYEGGTKEQYEAVLESVHPPGGLPSGLHYHAAGPTQDGWLVLGIWESQAAFDRFRSDTLIPTIQRLEGGFVGPPTERRTAEVANLVTADS
jgi:hypothetical protein